MNEFMEAAAADVERCRNPHHASAWHTLAVIWREVGLQAVLVYRFGRALRAGNRRVPLWPLLPFGWLLYALGAVAMRRCYGIRLALNADIGKGFWVGHFGGIEVVNCRLGEQCSVGQQTKVGSETHQGGPQIGDGVWIGAHARITGSAHIGSGVTIAPGARVTRNVPAHSLVAGDPGRVVFRGYSNKDILPAAPHQPQAA
jgi:serine O-acetyltransferase